MAGQAQSDDALAQQARGGALERGEQGGGTSGPYPLYLAQLGERQIGHAPYAARLVEDLSRQLFSPMSMAHDAE